MAARLIRSVVAGGVVYPAGTAATPDLREVIDARHWSGDDSVDTAAFEQAIAERDAQLAERAEKISELENQVAQLRSELTATYPKWRKADLEAEIAARNESREQVARIVLTGGNVEDLVVALTADDERLEVPEGSQG